MSLLSCLGDVIIYPSNVDILAKLTGSVFCFCFYSKEMAYSCRNVVLKHMTGHLYLSHKFDFKSNCNKQIEIIGLAKPRAKQKFKVYNTHYLFYKATVFNFDSFQKNNLYEFKHLEQKHDENKACNA